MDISGGGKKKKGSFCFLERLFFGDSDFQPRVLICEEHKLLQLLSSCSLAA